MQLAVRLLNMVSTMVWSMMAWIVVVLVARGMSGPAHSKVIACHAHTVVSGPAHSSDTATCTNRTAVALKIL